jgi:hypothetical protein
MQDESLVELRNTLDVDRKQYIHTKTGGRKKSGLAHWEHVIQQEQSGFRNSDDSQ